jgi:hypothetical protein
MESVMDHEENKKECNDVPGHSACQKKIGLGKCPTLGDQKTGPCKGHYRNPAANMVLARQWIAIKLTSTPVQAGT